MPMLKTVAKWIILTALIAAAVLVTLWSESEAARRRCAGIEVTVTGDTPADSIAVRGTLKEITLFDPTLLQKPTNAIDLRAIERHLGSLSNFENVECVITSQGKLRINITPMVPEIRVFTAGGSYYINKDGKHIAADAQFFTDVPVVSGHFTRSFQPKQILPLVRYIKQDSLLNNLVGMIEVRDANNILLIPRIAGHVINIGDISDLPRKKSALLAMYRQVMPYKGWETYDTISVKYRGQVVATRRDKSLAQHGNMEEETEDLEEAALQATFSGNADEAATAESIPAPAPEKKKQP